MTLDWTDAEAALFKALSAEMPTPTAEMVTDAIRKCIAESRTPEPVAEGSAAGEPTQEELRDIFICRGGYRALYNAGKASVAAELNRWKQAYAELYASGTTSRQGSAQLSQSAGAKCSVCMGTGREGTEWHSGIRACLSCHGTGRSPELTKHCPKCRRLGPCNCELTPGGEGKAP